MEPEDRIDEGYSEGSHSQDEAYPSTKLDQRDDVVMDGVEPSSVSHLQNAILALSEAERKETAYTILRSLPAWAIASVVDQLWPLFHKDPVTYFPAEIMSEIFSYLEPANLLEASRASKAWRARILDGRLWRDKFQKEGWTLDVKEVERFEQQFNARKIATQHGRDSRATRSAVDSRSKKLKNVKQRPQLSKRKDMALNLEGPIRDASEQTYNGPNPQSIFPGKSTFDEEMQDVSAETAGDVAMASQGRSEGLDGSDSETVLDSQDMDVVGSSVQSPVSPTKSRNTTEEALMLPATPGHAKLNYHHIYKQKRKLEENWNAGRYKNFQLPHRDHPEDAHTECVYTIQYQGKYLVSGSRDWTLRIWDLDSQRLAMQPLRGHEGSVLCLQFDPSPAEDLIISGSSDTHVILWRFSTGEMIQQLSQAHRESVLNLRFDKRFLVTCSKDKTIKIWSRSELRPGDSDYPVKGLRGGGQCPSYIIEATGIPQALKFGPTHPDYKMVLEPYTHLMTLNLHAAAVNAIQIYEDQLVSASGDRCLRVWDIHTGECSTRIEAHTKGIACVQYDGKRIVSGSSDNTIRIWDPISHVEVARLEGHRRLVRTIQAAFADVPGGRERLEADAAEVDQEFRKAQQAGDLTQPSRYGPQPVPGSKKPKDLRAINAKIPPSGGGGRWSHIVSGSYDETVIIWKKNADDEWIIGHKLRQEEALVASGPELPTRSRQVPAEDPQLASFGVTAPPNLTRGAIGAARLGGAAVSGPQSHPQTASAGPSQAQGQARAGPSTAQQASSNIVLPSIQTTPGLAATRAGIDRPIRQAPNPPQGGPRPRPNALVQAVAAAANEQPNARVFKLQFDARRIICCSQDPKIVGWDFANGDEEIIECSRFFSAPQ